MTATLTTTAEDRAARLRGRPVRGLVAAAVICSTGTVPTPVGALDLKPSGGIDTGTIATAEARKYWSAAKQHGAERVRDRDRLAFLPDGVRIGPFVATPSLETRAVFEDNVYGTTTNRQSDVSVEVRPEVRLQSQFARHALSLAAGGRFVRYADHADLDEDNGFISVDGALHIDHAHTLAIALASDYAHERRLAAGAPIGAGEKTPIWSNTAALGLTRDAGRLYGTVAAGYQSWDFSDVTALDGSPIDQDRRDTRLITSDVKLGYRFSPGFSFETKLRGLRQLNRGDSALDADAWGYEVVAGLTAETSPLLSWQILGGYGIRDFDKAGLATADAGLVEIGATWLPTALVTVNANVRRGFSEAGTGQDDTGRIETAASLSIDIEAARNLVVTIGADYRWSDFIGSNRNDETFIARAGVDYLHAKNWRFGLGFEHVERTSNEAGRSLEDNRLWLSGKLAF